jgi:hypothetical protein
MLNQVCPGTFLPVGVFSLKKAFNQMSATNLQLAKQASWRVPGSQLMISVKWCVQYKCRYQQIVRLHNKGSTVYN